MLMNSILVVDDEPEIRAELAEYLGDKGYRVVEAGDGIEGAERFQAEPFAAVITDMRMPRGTGAELIRRVREADPDIPVLVLMGHYSDQETEQARQAGADAVFNKPVRLRDLNQALESLLRRGEAAA